VQLPDITLRAVVQGEGPASLVLLHELGGSLESFDDVAERLSTRFRILRYDQRGAGQSEKPRRAFSLADHARDLAGVLAASGLVPPVCLAGVAAGAAIAVEAILSGMGEVAGLALCAPALTVPPERRAYLADRSALAAQEGMRAIEAATLARSYPEILRGDAARFADYRARFMTNDPVSYGHANMALAAANVADRLHEISVRCLVLAGQHDVLRPPADVEPLAKRIAGARFAMIDSGHLMAVQAPDAMATALAAFFASGLSQ
jgi:3-oxoadipate enol-lactonase